MSCSKSCTHCHALKIKCVRASADAPCARCQKHGLECVPHVRAAWGSKKRKRGRPKKKRAPRPSKKTKTNTAAAQPKGGGAANVSDVLKLAKNTTDCFHSPEVDLTAFRMISKLSPSHFALQTAVKVFMVMACRKASMSLLNLTTSFAMTVGLANIFPSLSTKKQLREVKRGDFSDIPPHVLRAHDAAVGINAAGSAAKNWGSDRIIFVLYKEFAPEGALFATSDEAWRLLNLDETEMQTAFNAHDTAVKTVLTPSDYNRTAYCVTKMVVDYYDTVHSGPITACTQNIVLRSPVEGNILGHMYSTIWLGTKGLDMVNIQEFVPLSKVSVDASALIIQGDEEDFTAAEAIMALGYE